MKATLARVTFKFFRTARYLLELMVWSRIVVARRTSANIRIHDTLRADKAVQYPQPQMTIDPCTSLEYLQHGVDIVFDLLFANLRKPNRLLPLRHATPAPAFAGVYLWDSAFIALIWRYWDEEVGLDVLRSVLALRDGDKLQHVVADFVRTDFTQPPLIAWALMRTDLYARLPPQELREIFQVLVAFNAWLNRHRRLECGLYFWSHPYESGVENSPRFSSRDEKVFADTRSLAAPDFSAYVVLQCEALARLAEVLGERDQCSAFQNQAQIIKSKMEQLLWNEEDGLYYDWDVRQQCHIRRQTIASLIPLAAAVPSPERATRLRRHIKDPGRFATTIPLPSVALSDAAFEKDMWRGPVWINTAFLVLDGLRRHHYLEDYADLAWRLCDGVFRVLQSEHQIYEFYDPQHFHTRDLRRKKGNWWKTFTLGRGPQKDFVGWSGLVNVLVIEALFGLNVTNEYISVSPAFPVVTTGFCFHLKLPQMDLQLSVLVLPARRYSGSVAVGGLTRQFQLAAGERFSIIRKGTIVL